MSIMSRTPAAQAPTPAAPGRQPAAGGRVVALQKPIALHGDSAARQVTLKPITARLLIDHGAFFKLTQGPSGPDFEIIYPVAAKWLEELTGIDEIVLGGMAPVDFVNCCRVMVEMINEAGGPGN